MPPHRHAYRPTVMGTRGAVASAHPLASMAGIRVLLEGGNAVDAAVAVGAALNVVEPFMSGAGGIGLMLISRARTRERHVLDFIGPAPRARRPGALHRGRAGGRAEVVRHARQPGRLARRARALRVDAARRRCLRPPSSWPRTGCRSPSTNVKFFEQARAAAGRSAEAERLYPGQRRAAARARSSRTRSWPGRCRQVAEGGAEAFYRGPIARTIARAVQEAGGWLTEADLAAFEPEWREPLAITYRGREVCYGAAAVLGVPDARDAQHPGGLRPGAAGATTRADYLHHLIEAIKLASADRLAYAYSGATPIAGLRVQGLRGLAAGAHRPGAGGGERGRATRSARGSRGQIGEGHPAQFVNEQTTHFACADAEGTVVSVTQTLGVAFGSGFAVPGTGLVLNNILKWIGPRSRVAQRAAARAARPAP